jgi:hypothetical protein
MKVRTISKEDTLAADIIARCHCRTSTISCRKS